MAKITNNYPEDFLDYLRSITNKRAKIVIDHILQNGFITTEDLEKRYGYKHPPRAVMDVRDAGIPLEKYNIKSKEGKSIAAYKFGDISEIQKNRIAGRIAFSKKFKKELYSARGGRCQICYGRFPERYFQIDHRIPYQVCGDLAEHKPEDFMLVCGSCNRAKSWSCEQCDNWKTLKIPSTCKECYWGNPINYDHIAMEKVRRIDIQWRGEEVTRFDALRMIANQNNVELPDYIKQILSQKAKNK